MALRPTKLESTALTPADRNRILGILPFHPTDDFWPKQDRRLFRLGLALPAGTTAVKLTTAGRVVRRLLKELKCSA